MKKLIVVSAIFVAAVGVLVWVGVLEASIPVLTPIQINSPAYAGGTVQLDGGQVAKIESYTPLVFSIAPPSDPSCLIRVESPRLAPESFKPGTRVSLRGEYDREKQIFHAYKISTQCPSRYEAAKEAGEGGSMGGTGAVGSMGGTDARGTTGGTDALQKGRPE